MINSNSNKRYDMRVAIGLFLIIFIISSGIKSIAVMFTELSEIGFSMAFIGLGGSICTISAMVAGVSIGKLVQKVRIKKIIFIASILSSLGYVLLATVSNQVTLLVVFVMVGFAMTFGGYTPAAILLARWFKAKYALVISIVFTGMSVGSAFISLMYGILQPIIGFQNTIFVLAGCQLVIPMLVLKFLIFENPEEVGQVPFENETTSKTATKSKKTISVINIKSSKAMKSTLCLHILLVSTLVAGGVSIVHMFLPMQVEVMGFSKGQSSLIYSIIMVCGAISTIVGGIISDKKSPFLYFMIAISAYFIGLAILLFTKQSYSLLIVMAVLMGISYPSTTSVTSLILKENFGQDAYSGIVGTLHALNFLGIGILNPLAGHFYDTFGNYITAFTIMGGIVAVAYIAMFAYPLLRKKAHKKFASDIASE